MIAYPLHVPQKDWKMAKMSSFVVFQVKLKKYSIHIKTHRTLVVEHKITYKKYSHINIQKIKSVYAEYELITAAIIILCYFLSFKFWNSQRNFL